MKFCLNKAAVIGGDKRQAYLAEILEKEGYEVVTYAVNCVHERKAASLKEALKAAPVIAAPVPFLIEGVIFSKEKIRRRFVCAPSVQVLSAEGAPPPCIRKERRKGYIF